MPPEIVPSFPWPCPSLHLRLVGWTSLRQHTLNRHGPVPVTHLSVGYSAFVHHPNLVHHSCVGFVLCSPSPPIPFLFSGNLILFLPIIPCSLSCLFCYFALSSP